MAFVEKETPTGTIDGANTSFTTANNISAVTMIMLGGIPYIDFTTSDNTITMTDAPPAGTTDFYVWYFSSAPADVSGTFTIDDFKTLWEAVEGQDAPSDTLVYYWLTDIDQQIYQKVLKIFPEKFIEQETINVVAETAEYTLPDDFWNVQPSNTGLYKVDSKGKYTLVYPYTEYGSGNSGFYTDGSNLVLTPEPATSDTLILRYVPERALYSGDTNTLILPERYQKFYCDWFSFLYLTNNEDYQTAGVRRDFAKEAETIIMREYRPALRSVRINGHNKLL